MTKAVPSRCFYENLYSKNAANSQENIFAEVWFRCNYETCSQILLDVFQIGLTSLYFFINI